MQNRPLQVRGCHVPGGGRHTGVIQEVEAAVDGLLSASVLLLASPRFDRLAEPKTFAVHLGNDNRDAHRLRLPVDSPVVTIQIVWCAGSGSAKVSRNSFPSAKTRAWGMCPPLGDHGCWVGIDAANLCDTMPRVLDRVATSACQQPLPPELPVPVVPVAENEE